MYGDRARIGLIVPSSNTTCEPEMARLCPEGVVPYATRILFEPSLKGLCEMKKEVERASRELSSEGISKLIAFCCTVGSLVEGTQGEEEIIDLIEKSSNTPAITTATAVRAAFTALGIRRVAIATPYTAEINHCKKERMEQMGYQVAAMAGYHENIHPETFLNKMVGRLLPEVAYEMGKKVDSIENEAVFLSCTNFRTIEILEKLEKAIGKPVISSNQATLWWALRKIGVKDSIKGYGRLLEKF